MGKVRLSTRKRKVPTPTTPTATLKKPPLPPPAKKKKKTRKKKPPKKRTHKLPPSTTTDSASDDSASDADPNSSPSELHKLLKPYSKSQLIDLITDAAINDNNLYARVRDSAERDIAHRKIFVRGLGWDSTTATLDAAFRAFGDIEDVRVVTDRATGKAKGYGFVQFTTRKDAARALKEPRKKIGNRIAMCQLAAVGLAQQQQQGPQESLDNAPRKIYVSNVHADCDPERLRMLFEKFGELEMGPIGFDIHTGKSRGFALFLYKTPEGARKALEEPYKVFEGHQLNCQKALDPKNKPPVQPPVLAAAAAQNILFSQNPSLNPLSGGLIANPSAAGLMPAQALSAQLGMGHLFQLGAVPFGGVVPGLGGYNAVPTPGLGLGGYNAAPVSAPGLGGYNAAPVSAPGLGGFNAAVVAPQGSSNLRGSSSVVGAYGSNAASMGLQQIYQNQKLGTGGGSLGSYPSHMG